MKGRPVLQCFAFQRSKESVNVSYQLTKRKRSSLIAKQIRSNLVYICMRRKFETKPTKWSTRIPNNEMITVNVSHERKKKEKKKILCRQIEQTISPRNTDISVRLKKQKFKCNRELRRLHCRRAGGAFEEKINLGILQFDPEAGIHYHNRSLPTNPITRQTSRAKFTFVFVLANILHLSITISNSFIV